LRVNQIQTKPIASFEIDTRGCVLTGTNLAMVESGAHGCVLTGTKPWNLAHTTQWSWHPICSVQTQHYANRKEIRSRMIFFLCKIHEMPRNETSIM
jgi:hypothetical protein